MITDNPTHLNCPYCPAQAYSGVRFVMDGFSMRKYACPAQHKFFILAEDTSFDYGFNNIEEVLPEEDTRFGYNTLEGGWLKTVLDKASAEYETWPAWVRGKEGK